MRIERFQRGVQAVALGWGMQGVWEDAGGHPLTVSSAPSRVAGVRGELRAVVGDPHP